MEADSEADDERAGSSLQGRQARTAKCSSARLSSSARAAPVRMMVPRETWPDDACEELQGAGWLVEVVRTIGKAESAKALCRFVDARTQGGQPYADEWLSCAALAAVPPHAPAGEGRGIGEAEAGAIANAPLCGMRGGDGDRGRGRGRRRGRRV